MFRAGRHAVVLEATACLRALTTVIRETTSDMFVMTGDGVIRGVNGSSIEAYIIKAESW
jgi:hypothetical protein